MMDQARILVVDDEKIIREGCSRILQKAGHEVSVASNGYEALEQIRRQPFDIVLLDIKMPEMDGMQVMEALRGEIPNQLILVITGYATIETAVNAMKAGAYDLLLKPFSADAMRIAVDRALDHLRLAYEMEELRREQARSLLDIANEQSRVRTIMNSMACGILVTDNEKNLVLYNPMAPHMLHMDAEDIIGRPISEVVPQADLVEMIDKIFGQDVFTAVEHEIRIDDSQYIRARAAPVLDSEEHVLGSVTVMQDVTHLKEMDRMKSEFVAMVSHELKAPLAAIQQQLDVLLAGMAGEVNEKQAHFLSRAQVRAQGLLDLINQLLDLSHIEAGQVTTEQEPTDPAPLVRQVVEFVRTQAEAKKINIRTDLPGSLPLISADPGKIDEVFMNLLSNAIKYTPEGGRIGVEAFVAGGFVHFRVSDTGYGIPKEDVPRIFDKFYRVKSDKTRSISGTGLGLPIVKGIVEAHLGHIKVDSQVGRGTTFEVMLPVLNTPGPARGLE